jgi:glycosyltransferase involved in cell wall biosynthesis
MMEEQEEILITVVVPTYNRAALIGKTISSLLNQECGQFEIIIVDDGSTDNTEAEVKHFTDPRIQYFKKNNEERGAARNFGARLAKGSYVNFFDSDDLAMPNHISAAVDAIKKYHHPEIFTLGYNVVAGDKVQKEVKIDGPVNEPLQKQSPLGCNSVFIRKDIITQYPFSTNREIAVSEDLLLWLTLSARFTIHGIPIITSSLIQHDQRSMLTDRPEKILRRMDLLVEVLKKDDVYMAKYGNKYLPYVQSEKISAAALSYALSGKKIKTISTLSRAIAINPSVLFSRRCAAVIKYFLLKW